MELRVLGIPRVPAARHRIEPQLQPPKRARALPEISEWCSLIAGRIQPAKHRALHLKEDVSRGAFGVQRTQGYIHDKNTACDGVR